METIKVIYLGNEIGRLKNPYTPMDGMVAIDPSSKFWKFAEEHPPLPMPNPNNDLVDGEEYLAVETIQAKGFSTGSWFDVEPTKDISGWGYVTRRIYTPVTEGAKQPALGITDTSHIYSDVQGETVEDSSVKTADILVHEAKEMLMNLIAQNHVPDECCPNMNDLIDELDRFLNHSDKRASDEVKFLEDVIKVYNDWDVLSCHIDKVKDRVIKIKNHQIN